MVITAGMGLLLGAVGFQLSASRRDSITVSPTLETESRGIVGQRKVGPTVRSRPFLDAVLEAKGFVQRVLVVDDLEGASSDDDLGLAEKVHQTTDSRLWSGLPVIYQR